MIEVMIDSIRISLVSQYRIVLLREIDSERQLPIWIGPCEADAITIELQDVKVARPLTQDLLKNVIAELGGTVSHVLIKELNESVFHARLFINVKGERQARDGLQKAGADQQAAAPRQQQLMQIEAVQEARPAIDAVDRTAAEVVKNQQAVLNAVDRCGCA